MKIEEVKLFLFNKKYRIYYIVVGIILLFFIILNSFVIPTSKYSKAMSAIDSKDYITAYNILLELNGYKDSEIKLTEIKPETQKTIISKSKQSDTVLFGAYEQDNNESNGKEDIEWIILDKRDDMALLISKYGLDCQIFDEHTNSWKRSSVRKWLNSTFLNSAFNEKEKQYLLNTKVIGKYNDDLIDNTVDKLFFLNAEEADKYLMYEKYMKIEPTKYAKKRGLYGDYCDYWLRDPINTYSRAAYGLSPYNDVTCVSEYGTIMEDGCSVDMDNKAIRPALWISLK